MDAPGGVMLSSKEYISLESACSSIKAISPAVLQEFARQVLGILDPESQFNPTTICVIESGSPNPSIAITYQNIGDYLLAATGKHIPVLLHTESGTVESNRVLVNRSWINRQLISANESLSIGAAIEEPAANQQLSIVQSVNSKPSPIWVDQPPPINSEGYKRLRNWLVHQNDQRKASESASKLAIQLEEAVARAEKAEIIASANGAEITVLLNRDRLQIMELSSKERQIQSLTLEIEKLREEKEDASRPAKKPRKSTAKTRARVAAQETALSMWAMADFKDYRIGEMADFIWAEMSVEGREHSKVMPEHPAAVVDWIKEVEIPGNASLPGRPRKHWN